MYLYCKSMCFLAKSVLGCRSVRKWYSSEWLKVIFFRIVFDDPTIISVFFSEIIYFF